MGRPHHGSFNAELSRLEVGQTVYFEATADTYAAVMRAVTQTAPRRPESMRHMRFTASLYRAVGTAINDVRVLVRAERIA